jgi:2,3-diketo-5-methylthio-1-phosphopentane phosphatase
MVTTPLPNDYSPLAARLPQPQDAQVWLDFDGTISQKDVLDELISRYAVNDSWKLIEERWQAGLIGSFECLSGEFALLRVGQPELERFLDDIPVDPGFLGLLQLLQERAVPVAILSDGIDWFIQRILGRLGVSGITIRSNTLKRRGTRLQLACPHVDAACESAAAHCKCASANQLLQPGRKTIYVGDGRSDLCPSRKAGTVFAKAALARSLEREGVGFIPFATLHDVAATLRAAWAQPMTQAAMTQTAMTQAAMTQTAMTQAAMTQVGRIDGMSKRNRRARA